MRPRVTFLFQAETDGSLWALDRQTFRKIVLKSAFQKRKMYESFLESVSLLECLEVFSLALENIIKRFIIRNMKERISLTH